jgi:hypothetical protein
LFAAPQTRERSVARCAATMFNGLVRPPCASPTPPARAAPLRSHSRAHRGPRATCLCGNAGQERGCVVTPWTLPFARHVAVGVVCAAGATAPCRLHSSLTNDRAAADEHGHMQCMCGARTAFGSTPHWWFGCGLHARPRAVDRPCITKPCALIATSGCSWVARGLLVSQPIALTLGTPQRHA